MCPRPLLGGTWCSCCHAVSQVRELIQLQWGDLKGQELKAWNCCWRSLSMVISVDCHKASSWTHLVSHSWVFPFLARMGIDVFSLHHFLLQYQLPVVLCSYLSLLCSRCLWSASVWKRLVCTQHLTFLVAWLCSLLACYWRYGFCNWALHCIFLWNRCRLTSVLCMMS